jgi:hypothetical protein
VRHDDDSSLCCLAIPWLSFFNDFHAVNLVRIIKLVRAIRNGWIKTKAQSEKPQEPPAYLLWADDNQADSSKTATGLAYIPASKPKLPGHAESYNPPPEYLPTEVCVKKLCACTRMKVVRKVFLELDPCCLLPAAYAH